MGISGNDKAPRYALSGVARAGATRSGYTSPRAFVSINGAPLAQGSESSLAITEVLNDIPNTAALTLYRGATEPAEGQDVVVTLGSKNSLDPFYAGTILNRTHGYVGTPGNWNAPINAVDYTWHLTRRRFTGSFTNAAPADIAAAIVAVVPGFTLSVQAGLANLDAFSQTDVTALEALTALAKRIGGYCDVSYRKVVKLFIADSTVTNPVTLTAAHATLEEFSYTKDLSRTRTRIYSEGGGGTALTTVSPGETILPLSLVAWNNPAGGTVKSGAQHSTYTGTRAGGGGSLVGPGAAPTVAPAAAVVVGAGVESGVHKYAYTDVTAAGESLPSPLVTVTVGFLANPATAPTVIATAGSGIENGVHQYAYSDVTAAGETLPTPIASVTHAPSQAAPTAIGTAVVNPFGTGPLTINTNFSYGFTFKRTADGVETTISPTTTFNSGPNGQNATVPLAGCTAAPSGWTRQWYRTKAAGGTFFQIPLAFGSESGGNFNENAADTDLSATTAPATNGTAVNRSSLSAIAVGPSGTTARKVWRTVAGGSQLKLLTTIADNTTTTYTDSTADASLGANAPTSNTATANQVSVSLIAVGVSPTTSRKLYRTVAGGSQLKLLTTIADNTTTTYTDSTPDASLGANAPASDTSNLAQPSGQVNAGSTTLLTASATPFSPTGGWALIQGGQVIRYTGITGNTLTGIPASGSGAITATIAYSSTITDAPVLIGLPASGPGSIQYQIKQGDPVNLLVQVDDLSAQAALAALIGGGDDGVIEEYIQDGTIGETEARARATAQLALLSTAQVSIAYKCRDRNTHAGRTITVNFGAPTNLSATFQIQRVNITGFKPGLLPTFTVQASSDRFSLDDLLRMQRSAAR